MIEREKVHGHDLREDEVALMVESLKDSPQLINQKGFVFSCESLPPLRSRAEPMAAGVVNVNCSRDNSEATYMYTHMWCMENKSTISCGCQY